MIFYTVPKNSLVEIQMYNRHDIMVDMIQTELLNDVSFSDGLYIGTFKCSRTGIDLMGFDKGIDRYKGIEYHQVMIVPSFYVTEKKTENRKYTIRKDVSKFEESRL